MNESFTHLGMCAVARQPPMSPAKRRNECVHVHTYMHVYFAAAIILKGEMALHKELDKKT